MSTEIMGSESRLSNSEEILGAKSSAEMLQAAMAWCLWEGKGNFQGAFDKSFSVLHIPASLAPFPRAGYALAPSGRGRRDTMQTALRDQDPDI